MSAKKFDRNDLVDFFWGLRNKDIEEVFANARKKGQTGMNTEVRLIHKIAKASKNKEELAKFLKTQEAPAVKLDKKEMELLQGGAPQGWNDFWYNVGGWIYDILH